MTPSTISILDVVALLRDVPERSLVRGQVGTVIETLAGYVFEVEFVDSEGRTYAEAALPGDSLIVLHHGPIRAA